jgi:hypothetical protein
LTVAAATAGVVAGAEAIAPIPTVVLYPAQMWMKSEFEAAGYRVKEVQWLSPTSTEI